MNIATTIMWPTGRVTTQLVDWLDRVAVANFSRVAGAALRKGAEVRTKRVFE